MNVVEKVLERWPTHHQNLFLLEILSENQLSIKVLASSWEFRFRLQISLFFLLANGYTAKKLGKLNYNICLVRSIDSDQQAKAITYITYCIVDIAIQMSLVKFWICWIWCWDGFHYISKVLINSSLYRISQMGGGLTGAMGVSTFYLGEIKNFVFYQTRKFSKNVKKSIKTL